MIRKATVKDVKIIHQLLNEYGEEGQLLSRALSELYDHVRDFWVYVDTDSDQIVGCAALQFCWEHLAEIRSLAVRKDQWGKNIGRVLVETVIEEAKQYGITELFTLTYEPDFFRKFRFDLIDRNDLPLKIWSDCISCVKFPDCDEIAMKKILEYNN